MFMYGGTWPTYGMLLALKTSYAINKIDAW